MPTITIPNGELVDRVTILAIKVLNIASAEAREECQRQLDTLVPIMKEECNIEPTSPHFIALRDVNEKLWHVEEDLRVREGCERFDARFIDLARSVYRLNDERYRIKRLIDDQTGSAMREEKELPSYD